MKNILQIALISMAASSHAENFALINAKENINEYRKEFEQGVSDIIYTATKNFKEDIIKNAEKADNVTLEGFVLYGIETKNLEGKVENLDIVVSLHNDATHYNYNIIRVNAYKQNSDTDEEFSPHLESVQHNKIPALGYFLLTDDLKNAIAQNDQSEYRLDFAVPTLRKSSFRAAFYQAGTEFDQLKFAKENHPSSYEQTFIKLLEESKAAVELKQKTDDLFDKLFNELCAGQENLVSIVDAKINEFITEATKEIKPFGEMNDQVINSTLGNIAAIMFPQDNNKQAIFIELRDVFKVYQDGHTSIDKLKKQCRIDALRQISTKNPNIIEKSIEISALLPEFNKSINNVYGEWQDQARKSNEILNNIEDIIDTIVEDDIKDKMFDLVLDYKANNLITLGMDGKGNKIYLENLLKDADEETKNQLNKLAHLHTLLQDILKHDLIIPTDKTWSTVIKSAIELQEEVKEGTLYGMYLYNSEMTHMKYNIDNDQFFNELVNMVNSEFESKLSAPDSKITEEDYMKLYFSIYSYAESNQPLP